MQIISNQKDIIVEGEDEKPVFYYSREERLASAPDLVKQVYSGEYKGPPKGLFKALVHTKSSRFIFGALVLTIVISFFAVFASGGTESTVIHGVKVKLTAFSFEDTVYVSLLPSERKRAAEDKAPAANNARTEGMASSALAAAVLQPADIMITAADNTGTAVHQSFFESASFENGQGIRTTFSDYDILSVSASITIQETVKKLECRVEKR